MSVNWRYIHAIPMLTVLTLMAASTAHVGRALKAMDSTVQVCNWTLPFTGLYHNDTCYNTF